MNATVTGTVTKVMEVVQSVKGKWTQEFVLKEENVITNHFIIQARANSQEQLDDIYLKGRVGAEVTCHCYLNGYRYNHKTYGETHGLRLVLNKIEP